MLPITQSLKKIAFEILFAKKIDTPFGKKTLDLSYEIPYLAGYSKNGKTIYIDKRIRPNLKLKNGKNINIIKYLAIHEATEKHLMDEKGYKYPYAHQKATAVEREAVEKDGHFWDEYQKYALSEVKRLKRLDPTEPLPKNLDVKPEIDTHDYSLLKQIRHQEKLH